MQQIVITGGGAIGAAIAYFLAQHYGAQWQITVLERDPAYTCASSALSASSIRQQFSQPLNMAMSAFGWDFLSNATQTLATPQHSVDLQLCERGYLYLASAAGADTLRRLHARQTAHGAQVSLLTPETLQQRFPWLATADLALASLGMAREGWFDGYALLMALRNKARALGVRFVQAEASGWQVQNGKVVAVTLRDGQSLACDVAVNAAGAWSARLHDPSGFVLPVEARRRTVFVLSSPASTPDCPLLIDPSGLWLRPEGKYWIAGMPPQADLPDLPLEPDHAQFQSLWETLAARIPAMEALRVQRAWAGYYEMNTHDHNAIIGPHPAYPNLWIATGFSGHGLQQAPAAGRASAEYLSTGSFQTLDLSALSPQRIVDGIRFTEECVI